MGGGYYYETWKRNGDDWFVETIRMQRPFWKVAESAFRAICIYYTTTQILGIYLPLLDRALKIVLIVLIALIVFSLGEYINRYGHKRFCREMDLTAGEILVLY
jgi:hypothetical protein